MPLPPTAWTLGRRHCIAALAGLAAFGLRGAAAGAPARLAAADWAAAESLLALGVTPLALSDTAVYRQWLPEIPLPDGVIDLGSRAEPNLELLAFLKPDRILVSNWQTSLLGLFNRIAPTETVAIVDARRAPYGNARAALLQVAAPLGRSEAAVAYLQAFDEAVLSLAAMLAPRKVAPVLVGVLHENGSQLFVYGEGSWVHEILLRLGLRNALTQPTSAFGNALIDLAQLAESPEATLLYLDQGERTRRAERALRDSTLWRNLPMVKEGRTGRIEPFYALGGIPSAWRCAGLIATALSASGVSSHG